MLRNKKGSRSGGGGLLLGYELNDHYAQISYQLSDHQEVETLSVIEGTTHCNIPLMLWKRKGVNQWLFGKEAAGAGGLEGTGVERLLTLARREEPVMIEGEDFDPAALLTLFIMKSLTLVNRVCPLEKLDGLMFTVEDLDGRMIEILQRICSNLHLETDRIFFQSHVESFYHYMLHQPEELWSYKTLLCDYDYQRLVVHELGCNRKTNPKVLYIDSYSYPKIRKIKTGPEADRELDQQFLEVIKPHCERSVISCVYLVGEGYKEDWCDETIRYLCRNRKGFKGNNLYSRGACYGIMDRPDRMEAEQTGTEYVFLSKDKLRMNLSMQVMKRGVESRFVIMNAGTNWFDARRQFDLILESEDTITMRLTPLTGGEPREIFLQLDELEELQEMKERPPWTTRLRLDVWMKTDRHLVIRVKDLGFGDFFPASGAVWIKEFDLAQQFDRQGTKAEVRPAGRMQRISDSE